MPRSAAGARIAADEPHGVEPPFFYPLCRLLSYADVGLGVHQEQSRSDGPRGDWHGAREYRAWTGWRSLCSATWLNSTRLLARLGDDRMDQIRRAHVEDVAAAVAGGGGRLVKTLGDGAMASFESGLGALRAAAAIQTAVERLDSAEGGIGIGARVGVAAGEPISDGEDLHGMAVVIASRLCSAAASGEVLVHDLVAALVASRDGVALEELQSYELKGLPTPVRAAALRGVRWRRPRRAPLTGRRVHTDTRSTLPALAVPPVAARTVVAGRHAQRDRWHCGCAGCHSVAAAARRLRRRALGRARARDRGAARGEHCAHRSPRSAPTG